MVAVHEGWEGQASAQDTPWLSIGLESWRLSLAFYSHCWCPAPHTFMETHYGSDHSSQLRYEQTQQLIGFIHRYIFCTLASTASTPSLCCFPNIHFMRSHTHLVVAPSMTPLAARVATCCACAAAAAGWPSVAGLRVVPPPPSGASRGSSGRPTRAARVAGSSPGRSCGRAGGREAGEKRAQVGIHG